MDNGNGNSNGNGSKETAALEYLPNGAIFQVPPLTREEEQKLLKLARGGDPEARNQLILGNMLLVASIARKYAFRRVEFADLVDEGVFGLIRAIEKYDPAKGKKFSTYAVWWILRSIRRATREQGRLIRLPEYMEMMVRRVWAVESDLRTKLGRLPKAEEVARQANLAPAKVKYLFSISLDPVSLDCPVGEDQCARIGDLLEDKLADRPESRLERAEFAGRVLAALEELDDRSARVIRWRFGILTDKRHSLPEIAQRINRTRQRVNQIELEAIKKLKKIMKRKEFSDLYNK